MTVADPFVNMTFQRLTSAAWNLLHTKPKNGKYSKFYGQEVFFSLFDLSLQEFVLTESEKNVVGPLLTACFPLLYHCLDQEILTFPTSTFEAACVLRSGLQFLLDDYQNYFTGDEIGMQLALFAADLDLDSFDNLLINYTPSENDPYLDVELSTRLKTLPLAEYHWWW